MSKTIYGLMFDATGVKYSPHRFNEGLADEGQRRDQDERTPAVEFFSDPQRGQRFASATGHDELAAVVTAEAALVTAEAAHDIFDGGGLMGSWRFPGQRLGGLGGPGRPFYLGV